jgi:hypothetical protein
MFSMHDDDTTSHALQIVGHQKRRRGKAKECKLSLLFLFSSSKRRSKPAVHQ